MKGKWIISLLLALATVFLSACGGVRADGKEGTTGKEHGIQSPSVPDDREEENDGNETPPTENEGESGTTPDSPQNPEENKPTEKPDEGEGNGSDEGTGNEGDAGGETPEEGEIPVGTTCAITYAAAPQCNISDGLFAALKMVEGDYPTSYVVGTGITVSALRNDIIVSGYKYTFIAWYYDEACTRVCEGGVIDTQRKGDVTLYAFLTATKIEEGWGGV